MSNLPTGTKMILPSPLNKWLICFTFNMSLRSGLCEGICRNKILRLSCHFKRGHVILNEFKFNMHGKLTQLGEIHASIPV